MQLIKYVEALEGFQSISNEKLPVSQSYKLAKIIHDLKAVCDPFFNVRAEKIKQIQEEHTSGGEVPAKVLEDFQKEIQTLLEEDIESEIKAIDISSFDIEVPAKTISLCMPFLNEETDADSASTTVLENSDKA